MAGVGAGVFGAAAVGALAEALALEMKISGTWSDWGKLEVPVVEVFSCFPYVGGKSPTLNRVAKEVRKEVF